ncbi:MAG: response regulator transcription factor [Rhodococcus qingshengii]
MTANSKHPEFSMHEEFALGNGTDQGEDFRLTSERLDPLVEYRMRIHDAFGRLAESKSTELIEQHAPRELAEACDFTRAMLSAVRGTRWVPLQLYSRAELDPKAGAFLNYVESDPEIPLANMLAETDMVRRRTAVLIDDSLVHTRSFKPIIEIARSPGYVAAPILVEGRTIGFMHADRVGQSKLVDDDDRRCIQAFTGELAVLYQRIRWSERLAERSRRIRDELERASDALTQIGSAAERLTLSPNRPSPPSRRPGSTSRRETILTRREWEVLGHVTDGSTNRAIAERLAVSEDTVKTHMRNVLRKLRVTTRSAAVARYLAISGGMQ